MESRSFFFFFVAHFHQLETPKTSNPVALRNCYFLQGGYNEPLVINGGLYMDHPYKWPKIDGGNLGLVISPRKKWSYFTLQKNCCLVPPCTFLSRLFLLMMNQMLHHLRCLKTLRKTMWVLNQKY